MTYGSTIHGLRRIRGLTQQQLAERAGLSLSLVRKIEYGVRQPSLATLQALATSLDVRFGDLLHDGADDVAAGRGARRVDGNQLGMTIRRARDARRLKRRQLAESARISVVFLKKIEAGERQPGVTTLSSLARGLDLQPHELLDGIDHVDLDNQPSQYRLVSRSDHASQADMQRETSESTQDEPLTWTSLMADSYRLNLGGYWIDAADKAIQASELSRYGSDEWSEAKLRAALLFEQASRDRDALKQIQAVEESLKEIEHPSPQVQARILNHRGWVLDEQYGRFVETLDLVDRSLPHAQEAGDPDLMRTDYHFRVRALSEQAMTEGDAWLEASPQQRIRPDITNRLEASLVRDWPASLQPGQPNPHDHLRRFMAEACLRRRDALVRLHDHQELFKSTGVLYLMDLAEAQVAATERQWKRAMTGARSGFEGYCQVHFPHGMALAAATEANAILKSGSVLTAKSRVFECLDLWILAMILHPYSTHPQMQAAYRGFQNTLKKVRYGEPAWADDYVSPDLERRVREREDLFQSLAYVYSELPDIIPHLIRASQTPH